jgi:hypothetical protein
MASIPSSKPHRHQQKHPNASSPNYISLSVKRAKEMSAPACSTLSSLHPTHRRIALGAVLVVFFWPLLFLALNLPWMITAGAAGYAFVFGVGKLASDAKEAAREHLDVDVDEKTRAAKKRLRESQFRGKDELCILAGKAQEWAVFVYKASLLAFMKVIDYLVTLLLQVARVVKGLAISGNGDVQAKESKNE